MLTDKREESILSLRSKCQWIRRLAIFSNYGLKRLGVIISLYNEVSHLVRRLMTDLENFQHPLSRKPWYSAHHYMDS